MTKEKLLIICIAGALTTIAGGLNMIAKGLKEYVGPTQPVGNG